MAFTSGSTPEQRKRIIITALILGAVALLFFVSAFFALKQ
jgi:small neutral amino acid transporter SnatA (MarC family)